MSNHMLAGYALAMLRKDNQILLLKRSETASFAPGHYSLIGGSVEKNETFRQALIREMQEEIGVSIAPENLQFVHVFYRKGTHNEIAACIFQCTSWQGEPYNKEPDKHMNIGWFSLDNLPEKMIPAHRGALQLIAQNIMYSEQPEF
jgi:8-oxo-dGTP diphosphatase